MSTTLKSTLILAAILFVFSGCKKGSDQAVAEKKTEVSTQQSVSEEAKKELENLRKEFDVTKQELNQFKVEAEKKEIELLKKKNQDSEQEVKELRLEKEKLPSSVKTFVNTFQGYVSFLPDMVGKKEIPPVKAEEHTEPTYIQDESREEEKVQVLFLAKSVSDQDVVLKITEKKTKEIFTIILGGDDDSCHVEPVVRGGVSYPGAPYLGGPYPGAPSRQKKSRSNTIRLFPGEYVVEINRDSPRSSILRAFVVTKKPSVEKDGQKYHAVVRY